MVLGGAGTGISALGAIQSGNATAAAAKYQAQVAANNAIVANQDANYATQAGEESATVEGLKNRAASGSVRAGMAANNVDVNSGSAADVQTGQRQAGLLDTETIRQNAALQNYGFRTQATGFTAEQGLQKAKAADATPGTIGALGSLLSGAASVGSKFSQFQDKGLLP